MRETDEDIAELDRLLGSAKAEYRALRHKGEAPQRQAPRQVRPLRRAAIAATIFVACLGVALGVMGPGSSPPSPSRLALPAPTVLPLTLRPDGARTATLSLDRSRLSIRTSLPRRPTRSGG